MLSVLALVPQRKSDDIMVTGIIPHPFSWNFVIYFSCNAFTVEQ